MRIVFLTLRVIPSVREEPWWGVARMTWQVPRAPTSQGPHCVHDDTPYFALNFIPVAFSISLGSSSRIHVRIDTGNEPLAMRSS